MISCTEFIPAYSELFTYLEEKEGREEVERFWDYLFKPDGKGIPLIRFLKKEGIRGCFSYWSEVLKEEAADCTLYLNEKDGWFLMDMYKCPSKGRLLSLRDEIGLKPYHSYCLHCDQYRQAVEQVGLKYIFNFARVDRASCSMLIYDPKVFNGKVVADEATETFVTSPSINEYFHPDFHSSLNMGLEYLGSKYGKEALREYLTGYVNHVYQNAIRKAKEEGISAVSEWIADTYKKEKAPEAVSFETKEGELSVKIAFCPGVKHLKSTGREVSKWYRYATEFVMEAFAKEVGLDFTMDSYEEETGAASFRFAKSLGGWA